MLEIYAQNKMKGENEFLTEKAPGPIERVRLTRLGSIEIFGGCPTVESTTDCELLKTQSNL